MDRKTAAILVACGVGLIAAWGPLDPPNGPITSTYKTLTEVEPRTAISAENTPGDAVSQFKITSPGSYYLTGSFKGVQGKSGILIAASRVTLDLNGFSLQGSTDSLDGVRVNTLTGVTIRNGTIYNWANGVTAGTATSCRLENLVSYSNEGSGFEVGPNGTASDCSAEQNYYGFLLWEGGVIRGCTAADNTGVGFVMESDAVATACAARDNGLRGFDVKESGTVTDCQASGSFYAGFFLTGRGRATRCNSRSNGQGFSLIEGNSLVECTVSANEVGVLINGNANTVERSTVHENSAGGIHIKDGRGNSIDGNLATYNGGPGIAVEQADNLIVRNRARGNVGNEYSIHASSDYGVILTNPGQGFTSSAAWANFAY